MLSSMRLKLDEEPLPQ